MEPATAPAAAGVVVAPVRRRELREPSRRLSRMRRRAAGGAVLALGLALPLGWAAGPSTSCADFALSLASDRGGLPSPVAAAEHFVRDGGVLTGPAGGWVEVERSSAGASVRRGGTVLHVVRGPDGTWQVDSGTCADLR